MRPPDGTASAGFPSLMISTAEARVPQPPGVETSTAPGETSSSSLTDRDRHRDTRKTNPSLKEQKVSWLLEHNKSNRRHWCWKYHGCWHDAYTEQKHGVRVRAHSISDKGRLAPDVSTRSVFASREPTMTRELNPRADAERS